MSSETICIIFLGSLYVYQSYHLSKLEKLVLKQLNDVWNFQHMVLDLFERLVKDTEKIKNDGVENE